MVLPMERVNVEPDYTKRLSEIYRELFVLHIERFMHLDLSVRCKCDREHIQMPSWVLDCSHPIYTVMMENARAAGDSGANVSFNGTEIMTATGVHLATVNRIYSATVDDGMTDKEIAVELRKLAGKLRLLDLRT